MNKYPLKELGHGIEIKHGFAFKGEFFSGEGEKIVLTPGNFYDEGGFKYTPGKEKFYTGEIPEDYICSKGDLIVAMTEQTPGLLGSTALVPEDEKFLHNQRIGLITFDNQKYDKLFLNYLFRTKSVRDQIALSSSGTKVKHTSPKRIYEVLAPKPPLDKQQKIGALLHSLDSKISLNNKINAELEGMAKLIYDYWFVQFDFPISKAQAAAMGKPELEGKPYKASGGPMVYNTQLKREIPEGWGVFNLGDLGDFKNGVNYDPSNPGEIACPIINVRNISASSYFLKNEDLDIVYLRESDVKKYSVHEGSIIIARSGIPGATRLISDFEENTLYCGFAIHFELEDLNQKLPVFFYLKSIEQLIKNGSGGTILKNVNQATLNALQVALPNNEKIIDAFNEIISPQFEKINVIQKEIQKLSELRDWLLPMLMNGQVSIKEAEEYADSYRESMAAEERGHYGK